jgi:hypothetical protein
VKSYATAAASHYTILLKQLNDILVEDAPRSGKSFKDVIECLIKYNYKWMLLKKSDLDYSTSNEKELNALEEVIHTSRCTCIACLFTTYMNLYTRTG